MEIKVFDSIHREKPEQILLAYGIPKKTSMPQWHSIKMKLKDCSTDGDTNFFDMVVDVLQGNTLAPYLVIICQDYVL